jgi:predicted PurR-regulated permease PerM
VPEGELVTPGMRIAGAWSWRILVVLGVVGVLVFLVMQLRAVVIPVFVGVLLAALMNPLVDWLHGRKVPRVLAVIAAALVLIAVVGGLGYLVATQVSRGADDLRDRSLAAYSDFQKFLLDSPLHVTSQEFQNLLDQAGAYAEANWQSLLGGVVTFGSAACCSRSSPCCWCCTTAATSAAGSCACSRAAPAPPCTARRRPDGRA